MNTILRTRLFDAWLRSLRDRQGQARILARIRSAEAGNFGDCEPVGAGVSEMRVDWGPGYRVYFIRRALTAYVLLLGGDKSTQRTDIKRARDMARALKQ